MTDFSNKTALVTGASRGIGHAIATRLAADGAHVIVHYASSRDRADALVADIHSKGGRADAVRADLAAADGAHQLAEQVKALGVTRLDTLVLNAGTATLNSIEEQTVEDFDHVFALNVRAPFFLTQQLLPLLGDGSSVTFISSVVARIAFPGALAYAATKSAIDNFVLGFAAVLGPRGVRVNAVAPGAIETDLAAFLQDPAARQHVIDGQALKRIGQPDDIASAVALIASDDARWITGRTIEVSGGAYLG